MKCRLFHIPISLALALSSAVSCGQTRKLADIVYAGMSAQLSLPSDETVSPSDSFSVKTVGDTLRVVGLDGREVLIMRAVRDDETGDMVATEQLDAAVVSARFRNVAERNGMIELEFQVTVPAAMRDSHWQLRLHPDLFAMDDSLRLDDLVVTGTEYRKKQMHGYEQYSRFENRILSDPDSFIDKRTLSIFLSRNAGKGYISAYQAEDHYTNHLAMDINERRKLRLPDMWRKYVKIPLLAESIRLDTVLVRPDGDFEYNYVQALNTRPGLRKIDVKMCGEIYDGEKRLCSMPAGDPLTFYVSSLSFFADTSHVNATDTTYMAGIRALVDHDYRAALARLVDYGDYNTAVAMVALDHNSPALSILNGCPRTAKVNYMLALVHSRLGDDRTAVECYMRSCSQEPSFLYRGNLDPEIAELIRKYKLKTDIYENQ